MNGIQKFQIHRDDRSTDRLPAAHTWLVLLIVAELLLIETFISDVIVYSNRAAIISNK